MYMGLLCINRYASYHMFSGVAAGIYATNSPDDCRQAAVKVQCQVMVVENDRQLAKIVQISDELPLLRAIVQYKGQPQSSRPQHQHRVPVYSVSIRQSITANL